MYCMNINRNIFSAQFESHFVSSSNSLIISCISKSFIFRGFTVFTLFIEHYIYTSFTFTILNTMQCFVLAKGKELNLVCSPNHIEEVIESVIKKSAIYGHKQAEKINRNLVETIKSVANGVYLKETEPTTLHQANSGFNGIPEDLLINSKTLSLLQPYIRLELLSNEVICNNTPKIYRKQVVPRKRDGPRNKNTTLKRKILQKSKCLRLGMNQNRKIRKKVLRDGNKNSIPVLETSTDNVGPKVNGVSEY